MNRKGNIVNVNFISKLAYSILSVGLLYLGAPVQTQAAPTLLAYWDFNNDSDPTTTLDKIYAFSGALENGATFTAEAEGRTGLPGDRAMDFGPGANELVRVSKVPFMNLAGAQNQMTIAFWQKLATVANSSAFWGVSPSSNNGERGIQAHTPWSDNTIYFDSAGCCGGDTRINKNVLTWDPAFDFTQWHHFAFVKDGTLKQIWIDGQLFHSASGAAPLPTDFTRLMIGADSGGGSSLQGLEDDFAVFAGALDAASIGLLFAGTAPDKLPGIIIPSGPLIGGVISSPAGFTLDIVESATTAINPATLALKLDNNAITASSVTKVDLTTTVVYKLPAGTYFASGSIHSLNVSVKDVLNAETTAIRPFTIAVYQLLPASARVTADKTKPGFLWNVHQNNALQGNDNERPEQQLAGKLIDAATSLPYDNTADPSFAGVALAPADPADPTWAPLKFEIETVINLSQTAGDNNGSFRPDEAMPGIPSNLNGIAAEIITYLDLPAGLTTMGVNSDDGFRTKSGQPLDAFKSIQVGEFNGGRGAADTLFSFVAETAGVYCFRTVWEEGGGGANIEWFTVNADGSRVLVNDTANGGVPAYRATTTGLAPYVRSVSPGVSPRQLNGVSTTIIIDLADGATEKVDDASVVLKLDGKTLATTKDRVGNTVTLTYAPDGLQIPSEAHTGELSFKGTAATVRNDQWTFRNLKSLILPAPTILETFNDYPEDTQPTDWVAWNFTAHNNDGRDITSQTSESYEDWVLVDVAHISSIDGGRPYNITPGQFIEVAGNRVEILNGAAPAGGFPEWLMDGNVLYAESDSRNNADSRGATDFPNNGQTQFITTKPYDLSAFKGVVITFSSIYEQNQDSIGAVEYSVDGGVSWLPVMYFLEEPDIKLNGDGTVNAARTFLDANTDTSSWVVNGVAKGDKYGDGIAAPITDALGPYVVPRINDGQVEGKRIEVARLDQAAGKKDVRLRLASMGTDSWYFAIDNLAFYDIVPPGVIAMSIARNGASATISWVGGTAPYLLERKASLSDATWVKVLTTSSLSATVAIQGKAGFFRVSDKATVTVQQLTASLNGAKEKPNAVNTTGTGITSFSLEGNKLWYYLTYENLSANATAAHIHGPASVSQAAGVLQGLGAPSGTSGSLTGVLTLSDTEKAHVLAGNVYVNIHTSANPGGEIRGQVVP